QFDPLVPTNPHGLVHNPLHQGGDKQTHHGPTHSKTRLSAYKRNHEPEHKELGEAPEERTY
ncbi:hypothetical protein AAGG42_22580, partial [Stenotrophomonas maltophilia]